MNQEKIMKRKMYIATAISILFAIALSVFIALYVDETKKTQAAYRAQYIDNMKKTYQEIDVYLERKTDRDLHYSMILTDLGAARAMIFLLNSKNCSEDKKNTINEFFYCFVKYPEQMTERLEDSSEAIKDIVQGLDKGYEEADLIVDSINKMGS